MKNITAVLAAFLLLLMGILAGGAALRESITVDEVAHIGAGVSYLQRLDMRMNVEHPPLANVLAAIPLVARGVHSDYANISWSFSNHSFGAGQPGYALVNDSNLDWNHALPEVNSYVQKHGLTDVLVDEYGFNDPVVYVPQARFWNCQQPASSDAGRWAFVSADMIEDAHNCIWLLKFPHEILAGGSMYAFHLPQTLPAVGAPGGPPPDSEFHTFGVSMPGYSDARLIFLNCIRDPKQLHMMVQFAAERARRAAQQHSR